MNVKRLFRTRPQNARRRRALALASATRQRLDQLNVEQGTHGLRFWGGTDGDV